MTSAESASNVYQATYNTILNGYRKRATVSAIIDASVPDDSTAQAALSPRAADSEIAPLNRATTWTIHQMSTPSARIAIKPPCTASVSASAVASKNLKDESVVLES